MFIQPYKNGNRKCQLHVPVHLFKVFDACDNIILEHFRQCLNLLEDNVITVRRISVLKHQQRGAVDHCVLVLLRVVVLILARS